MPDRFASVLPEHAQRIAVLPVRPGRLSGSPMGPTPLTDHDAPPTARRSRRCQSRTRFEGVGQAERTSDKTRVHEARNEAVWRHTCGQPHPESIPRRIAHAGFCYWVAMAIAGSDPGELTDELVINSCRDQLRSPSTRLLHYARQLSPSSILFSSSLALLILPPLSFTVALACLLKCGSNGVGLESC